MPSGSAALVGGVGFAAALALAVTWPLVNFGVLVGGHVLVGDRTEAVGVLGKVGFGLRVLEVKQWVVLVLRGIFWLSHGEKAGRNVGGLPDWYDKGHTRVELGIAPAKGH